MLQLLPYCASGLRQVKPAFRPDRCYPRHKPDWRVGMEIPLQQVRAFDPTFLANDKGRASWKLWSAASW